MQISIYIYYRATVPDVTVNAVSTDCQVILSNGFLQTIIEKILEYLAPRSSKVWYIYIWHWRNRKNLILRSIVKRWNIMKLFTRKGQRHSYTELFPKKSTTYPVHTWNAVVLKNVAKEQKMRLLQRNYGTSHLSTLN